MSRPPVFNKQGLSTTTLARLTNYELKANIGNKGKQPVPAACYPTFLIPWRLGNTIYLVRPIE